MRYISKLLLGSGFVLSLIVVAGIACGPVAAQESPTPALAIDAPGNVRVETADDRLEAMIQAFQQEQEEQAEQLRAEANQPVPESSDINFEDRIAKLEARTWALERAVGVRPKPFIDNSLTDQADPTASANAPWWTEADAIEEVQYELRRSLQCGVSGCRAGSDPILRAFRNTGLQPTFINAAIRHMLRKGEWSALYEPSSMRWRIEGRTTRGGTTSQPVVFYAYERTGLMEAGWSP